MTCQYNTTKGQIEVKFVMFRETDLLTCVTKSGKKKLQNQQTCLITQQMCYHN